MEAHACWDWSNPAVPRVCQTPGSRVCQTPGSQVCQTPSGQAEAGQAGWRYQAGLAPLHRPLSCTGHPHSGPDPHSLPSPTSHQRMSGSRWVCTPDLAWHPVMAALGMMGVSKAQNPCTFQYEEACTGLHSQAFRGKMTGAEACAAQARPICRRFMIISGPQQGSLQVARR